MLRLLLILLLTLTLPAETYRIRHADPDEIISLLSVMVPDAHFYRTCSSELTLEGPPEAIAQALELLRTLDQPRPTISIELRPLAERPLLKPEWLLFRPHFIPSVRRWDEPAPEPQLLAHIPPGELVQTPPETTLTIPSDENVKIALPPYCTLCANPQADGYIVLICAGLPIRVLNRSSLLLDADGILYLLTLSCPDI